MLHWCYIPYTVSISGSDVITVLALQCYHSYRSLRGWLIVKCFCFLYFSLQRGVKDVFFKTRSWSTQMYLCIFVQMSIGNGGNDKRGIMDAIKWVSSSRQEKDGAATLKVVSSVCLVTELLFNYKDFQLTETCTASPLPQLCQYNWK